MNAPTTPEDAAVDFRCDRYLCTMTGISCARQHVKARQTRAHNREHCIACPAGEARARLLNVGPVVCQVPGGDDADDNRHREVCWFSPHCVGARQPSLFDMQPEQPKPVTVPPSVDDDPLPW